jgi:hypothetical protein
MGSSEHTPPICTARALEGSRRRSHTETMPFSPAVQMTESAALYTLAAVRFPWSVLMVLTGPWLSLRGSNSPRVWSDAVAANPVATGRMSRTYVSRPGYQYPSVLASWYMAGLFPGFSLILGFEMCKSVEILGARSCKEHFI